MTDRISFASAGARRVQAAPRPDEYAPYHTLDAFQRGVCGYNAGDYCNPYILNSVHAQAYDRGLEYAMRASRFAGK